MNRFLFFIFLGLLSYRIAFGQAVSQLYAGKAPGSENWTWNEVVLTDSLTKERIIYDVTTPTLTAFLPSPDVALGTAIVICPGGGWNTLLLDKEGIDIAKQLRDKGIAAFVLTYRLVHSAGSSLTDRRAEVSQTDLAISLPMAIADGRKAIEYVRQRASVLGIQQDRIGLMGLSTGGALALAVGQSYTEASRPDFLVSIYPYPGAVVTKNVPADAPPLFIYSAKDSSLQSAAQFAQLYTNWLAAGKSVEFHLYANKRNDFPVQQGFPADGWMEQLKNWMNAQGYLTKQSVSLPSLSVRKDSAVTVVQRTDSPQIGETKPAQNEVTRKSLPPAQPKEERISIRKTPLTNSGLLLHLSGVVRDSATGRPLAGVAIVIDYRKNITGTNTNEQGHYAIDLPTGDHILIARLVGYTPVRKAFRLTDDLTVNIKMVTVESQLEEVVVTTKGFDQTVRQPLLGVNQLNVNALKKLPAALGEVDLLRGLQMLPGVSSVGEASNGVNIRGGTTDQNLILLDDTPIFNPTHMFGLFSVFLPDVLNTVDLYKGNVPARFGGRAASVLDVTLRNPNLDKFSLSGGVSVVSNKLTADIPIVKGKFGIVVAGRGAFNDFLLPIVSDRLANIKAKFGDAVLKAFWRIDNRNTLTATGYFSKDLFQTDLLANLPNVNGVSTRYDHQTVNVMARWFRTLSSRVNLQTTGVYVHYVPRILSPELSGNLVTLRSSVLQRQIKSNLNFQLTNQKLEIGISGTHYRIEPGSLLPGQSDSVNPVTTPTENALELALHGDYERSLGDKLAVSVGLRYSQFLSLGPALIRRYASGETRDDFSVIDSTRYGNGQIIQQYGGPEPRLGIRYTLGQNSSLKFGYNLMRQYLQVVTNTTTPLPTSRWKTSDINIKPQVSQLVTAGYFLNFKDNIYELTVEGYWRLTEHIIDYRPGADFLLQPYPETQLLQGRSKAYGIETMISKKKGELTGWINYTYARTLNQVYEGSTIEQSVNNGAWYRANYDRPHTVNANMTIDVDRHNSFGFTFAYSTGRPYSAPTGYVTIDGAQYPYYGVRNNERLPDYHRFDFTWNIYNPGMRNRRWEGRWAFTIYNLYGQKNAYSIFFKTENGKTNAYKLQIFAAPIVSLAYNFIFK
ncbi:carboxypeptidase-like regulatory domain-containing protein [Spirosoma validum]|uniref:Carboxypeptidase-like regulatory domain-containing protein n=1 Tax=Spirosoma validum TaxID=2771355 RepID=A0A927B2J6_9BACT|nr:carboxypeptidase-like regulatory domain-containing protein [Spirosoma validum]MBD2754230.1 carboxypeptidase-like regulatory domain-containing protein [Spirosoma validum]